MFPFIESIYINPIEVIYRIIFSFAPPVTQKLRKIPVDIIGPVLSTFVLSILTDYAKVLAFVAIIPLFIYVLCRLGGSKLSLTMIYCLVGYSLYGCIFTQLASNLNFFYYLSVYTGLSTLRVIMVVLASLRQPAVRLLIGTGIGLVYVFFMIYLHISLASHYN